MADFSSLTLADIDAPAPIVVAAAGRDDRDRASEPHRHARGELLASTQGLLSVGVEDGSWVVPAAHAFWLPPHHLHYARSHGAFQGWIVFIAASACGDLPKQPCTLRTSDLLHAAILRAAQWQAGPLDATGTRLASVIIDEIRGLPVEPLGLPHPRDLRLQRIAQALLDEPAHPRDLTGWADWAGVGARTLSRRFVTETGFTFTEWRQRARLMRSLEMLAAGQPVTTVAFDLGYSSVSAFITLFRKTFGVTPGEHLRRHQRPLVRLR